MVFSLFPILRELTLLFCLDIWHTHQRVVEFECYILYAPGGGVDVATNLPIDYFVSCIFPDVK